MNKQIEDFQPKEEEIYLRNSKGESCANLISIIDLKRLREPIPVSRLIKISDNAPYGTRTQSGNWSAVEMLPEWAGPLPSKEAIDSNFQNEIAESFELSSEERRRRLDEAPKIPEKIVFVTQGFRRNPDVVAEVLRRSNGRCESCGMPAPFVRASDGSPYLEVHHRVFLANGGEDTVQNAMAVCPNCHCRFHYGQLE